MRSRRTDQGTDQDEQGGPPGIRILASPRCKAATAISEGSQVVGRRQTGDGFCLEHRATRPLWVYVLSQDQEGEPGLLFPLPGSSPRIRWPATRRVDSSRGAAGSRVMPRPRARAG